jgi:hypothetical protein
MVLNAEFLAALGPCMESSSCAALDNGEYLNDCYDAAAAQVGPHRAVLAACNELVRRDFECGFDPDLGRCVESLKVYKATVLNALVACTTQGTCDGSIQCYEGVFQ